ncbi:3-methyl-2-oxobutanoate hydroxymethyltransferase [Chitinispirillum alkaliphilum]|nr:3-methyl-2-oxobutanoate hydroxymethyltransferase [Chitinispirillum alkaliphilum]
MKKNIDYLKEKKRKNIPVTMLTAYDYPTAVFEEEAGVDCILVGDSVGTNVLGYSSERDVTLSDMVHHLRAVSRGVKDSFLIADLPFGTADTLDQALGNSRHLLDNGADCVKLEGWAEKKAIVKGLVNAGVNVCAHIGYNPQIHEGKPRTFGRTPDQALMLLRSSIELEQAGASLIVLEKIPAEVARIISTTISIPTIGIGSGADCDGQVLVIGDLLGMTQRVFKHAKPYASVRNDTITGIKNYITETKQRQFPGNENCTHLTATELEEVRKLLKEHIPEVPFE